MRRPSRTRYALLGALLDGPKSGYVIRTYLSRVLEGFWQESYGQIYPTLRKLHAEGLIELVGEVGSKKGASNAYRITRRGRASFRDWAHLPTDPEVRRSEFGLKLFFGSAVGPEVITRHVERLRMQAEDRRHSCERNAEMLRNDEGAGDATYWLLGLGLAEATAQATIEWCEQTTVMLAARDADPS